MSGVRRLSRRLVNRSKSDADYRPSKQEVSEALDFYERLGIPMDEAKNVESIAVSRNERHLENVVKERAMFSDLLVKSQLGSARRHDEVVEALPPPIDPTTLKQNGRFFVVGVTLDVTTKFGQATAFTVISEGKAGCTGKWTLYVTPGYPNRDNVAVALLERPDLPFGPLVAKLITTKSGQTFTQFADAAEEEGF